MKNLVMAALLSAFVAAPVAATDMYIGVKLGTVNYGYVNVANNSQAGYGLLGGYIINENFAVEAEYNILGGFDSASGNIKGSALGVSGVGSLPLNQEFSIFGKLGIASSTLKDTAKPGWVGDFTYNHSGVTAGFGGQYNTGNEMGLQFGIDIYPVGGASSSTSSASMMYIGGVFNF